METALPGEVRPGLTPPKLTNPGRAWMGARHWVTDTVLTLLGQGGQESRVQRSGEAASSTGKGTDRAQHRERAGRALLRSRLCVLLTAKS